MKLIAIGDIHGRTDWKQIVSNIDFDKVVFVGDYFDTDEDITPEQQKSNFEDLLTYKKENMNKVVLLLGNHDFHYLRNVNETYYGFQELHKTDFQKMLHKAIDSDLMQMCFIYKNYLFSHAGVTKTWLSNNGYINNEPLEIFINNLFKNQPLAFIFTIGVNNSTYGDDVCQSPIWVRPQSLLIDALIDYIQIVGHTTQIKLNVIDNKIFLIDSFGMSGQFLCIDNGKITILQLSRRNR
jgi:hypothetical protein